MKKILMLIGALILGISLISGKNKSRETAQKDVDSYIVFIDSVVNLEPEIREAHWRTITKAYYTKLAEAEAASLKLNSDRQKAEMEKIAKRSEMYERSMGVTENLW